MLWGRHVALSWLLAMTTKRSGAGTGRRDATDTAQAIAYAAMNSNWIPASAGMTKGAWIPACAGMTYYAV